MKSIYRFGLAAAAILVMAAGIGPADAASVTYTYNSTCSSAGLFPPTGVCSTVGLTDGDPVSGTLVFNDANFVPNGSVTVADLLSFDFSFGTFSISSSATAPVTAIEWTFDGALGPDVAAFSTFNFFATTSIIPSPDGPTVGAQDTLGFAGVGHCAGVDCQFATIGNTAAPFLAGTLTTPSQNPSPTHIPEPATSALFGFGLLALGALGWRRRAIAIEHGGRR